MFPPNMSLGLFSIKSGSVFNCYGGSLLSYHIHMYGAAILATLIILISLVFLNNFEKLFQSRRSFSSVNITIDHNTNLSLLVNLFEQFDVKILSIEITNIEKRMRNVQIKVERNKRIDKIKLYDELSRLTGVRNIS